MLEYQDVQLDMALSCEGKPDEDCPHWNRYGSDNKNCVEFCVTSHHFTLNKKHDNARTFSNAAIYLGCAERVHQGVVPNEFRTWLYGRGAWCRGQEVKPLVVDITN
ncbi:hypothetical protein TrispH2_004017 [Trichoplax sp. H2]|nr:hypothetical protein TrispH2_004017 [Trichoplax sp. H2]|eukprot:RDD43350.1 hypothetical protein TrispH2_004017 [Trichoplax sp. H2]